MEWNGTQKEGKEWTEKHGSEGMEGTGMERPNGYWGMRNVFNVEVSYSI